jgi:predicted RNA polymerase sigma factor
VLSAIYLTFTEGHSPYGTSAVVRDDLCEEALRLAAGLHRLLPGEPEATGLLALILPCAGLPGSSLHRLGGGGTPHPLSS